jgi:hypothetical protein
MGQDDLKFTAPNTNKLVEIGIPEEGSPNLGRFLYQKFQIAKKEKDRLELHPKWMRNYELHRGKHFKSTNSKWPLVPVNLAYMVVGRTKAHLTDNKPRFEIVPHDEMTKEHAPVMNTAANSWWKRTKQQKSLSDTIHNSELYGSTIEKTIFDPDMEGGLGDTDNKVVDPFKFFPWPGVKDIQRMPFFFEIEIPELEEIIRNWSENGHQVKADKQWSTLVGKERERVKAGTLANRGLTDNLPNNYAPSGGITTEGINRAMVIRCWMKDYSMEDIVEQQPIYDLPEGMNAQDYLAELGQEPPVIGTEDVVTGQKYKYPGNIRCVHIANDGKVVLDDLKNPSINPNLPEEITQNTYLWDKYPYQKADSNTDTSNFWAFSSIEQIEILMKEINKKVSQIAAYIDKTVRPTLIIPNNLGIQDHQISNLAGQKWFPNNPIMSQYIRYLLVPPLPSDFYNYLELLLKLVDILTGIHDVTEGRKPKGVSAASAIIALQEKAQTMFREKIRNLDLLLEERGRMWISHFQNWYTEARKLKLSGRTAEIVGSPFTAYRGTEMQGEYSFEVVPGSTMPKSMWARREQALQLYGQRAIDQKALLDEFDWPNRDEIIHRMQMGIIGQMLEKLQIAGIDPKILQQIQFVLSLEEKDFKKLFQQLPTQTGGNTASGKAKAGSKK